ncbi:MAG: phage antirepressor N-terminal domain-containing protein [Armatimonadetes bacterium]|nr:phage antirepressor N-terminal domain-containing protein [Armatimonadota bacterium]
MNKTKAIQPLAVERVHFYGDTLIGAVVERNGKTDLYVAVRPICERFGLAWQPQHRKLVTHRVLSKAVIILMIPSEGGEQPTLCLRLDYLPGYLLTVNPNKVRMELRERLELYQEEAHRVLRDYFLGPGYAINPARVDLARLEIETERLKIERIKAQAELERVQAEREKNNRLLAFVEKYALPTEYQKAIISRLAGLELEPVKKHWSTEELAAEFTFKHKEKITTKRLAMLAKAGGIRPNKEAGEMENDYAVVSPAPAVNPKTGRVIEGKVVEQILYNERGKVALEELVKEWLLNGKKAAR